MSSPSNLLPLIQIRLRVFCNDIVDSLFRTRESRIAHLFEIPAHFEEFEEGFGALEVFVELLQYPNQLLLPTIHAVTRK